MLLGRDREEGSPLKLRRGIRLLLLRNELASWLAEEMLLVVVGFAGGSQASLASLRPCSHGATLVVISSGVIGGVLKYTSFLPGLQWYATAKASEICD